VLAGDSARYIFAQSTERGRHASKRRLAKSGGWHTPRGVCRGICGADARHRSV